MKEHELYIKYIMACRKGDEETIAGLFKMGFRPDRQRLLHLAKTVPELKNALLNEVIIIKIDSGHIAGHIYGDYPDHKAGVVRGDRKALGFYPQKEFGLQALYGPGKISDEINESRRIFENLPTVMTQLRVPQEVAIRLSQWLEKEVDADRQYSLLARNCIAFTDTALQQVGFVDGLTDKFNAQEVAKLKFRPVQLGLNPYFRVDNHDNPIPDLPALMEGKSKEWLVAVRDAVVHPAAVERDKANRHSFENHVNMFFNEYHGPQFYQAFLKGKTISQEDYLWVLQNHLGGYNIIRMEYTPLRAKLLQLCRPPELRYSLPFSSVDSQVFDLGASDWTLAAIDKDNDDGNGRAVLKQGSSKKGSSGIELQRSAFEGNKRNQRQKLLASIPLLDTVSLHFDREKLDHWGGERKQFSESVFQAFPGKGRSGAVLVELKTKAEQFETAGAALGRKPDRLSSLDRLRSAARPANDPSPHLAKDKFLATPFVPSFSAPFAAPKLSTVVISAMAGSGAPMSKFNDIAVEKHLSGNGKHTLSFPSFEQFQRMRDRQTNLGAANSDILKSGWQGGVTSDKGKRLPYHPSKASNNHSFSAGGHPKNVQSRR